MFHPGPANHQRIECGRDHRNLAIIVSDISASADILGIGFACLMTRAIAAMTVAVRRHRNTPMVASTAVSNVLGSLVSIPFAQSITASTGAFWVWLAFREAPTLLALVGGALVMRAVIADIVGDVSAQRQIADASDHLSETRL